MHTQTDNTQASISPAHHAAQAAELLKPMTPQGQPTTTRIAAAQAHAILALAGEIAIAAEALARIANHTPSTATNTPPPYTGQVFSYTHDTDGGPCPCEECAPRSS